MSNPHSESAWAILLSPRGEPKQFLVVMQSIVTRPTRDEAKKLLSEWRRLMNQGRTVGKVVKVRVAQE